MLLKECPLRATARLLSFQCSPTHALRMQELGLRPGVELVVTQRAAFGGRVINVRGSRLAVDAASTRRMEVELIDHPGAVISEAALGTPSPQEVTS